MNLLEQKILFERALAGGKYRTDTIISHPHAGLIEYTAVIHTASGRELQTFRCTYKRRQLRRFLKTLDHCPHTRDSFWDWRRFVVDNAKVMPGYLPMNEIKHKTTIEHAEI